MWKSLVHVFLNQIFPIQCLHCSKKGDRSLCSDCLGLCEFNPKWETIHFLQIWTAFSYHKSIHAKLMHAIKYKGDQAIVVLLFQQIQLPNFYSIDYIIPVPLHKKKQCRRGFNQSKIIANHLSKKSGIEGIDGLIRIKPTKQQAKLSKEKRQTNVRGSFLWQGGDLKGKKVLLVDDVISTGSTIEACYEALKNSNCEQVEVFCLFRS